MALSQRQNHSTTTPAFNSGSSARAILPTRVPSTLLTRDVKLEKQQKQREASFVAAEVDVGVAGDSADEEDDF
eukprot:COSAG05_NODE_23355_length_258_cov_1.289308_1_plen_72_part_01